MTKITFETKTNTPDYRILIAKPGVYKSLLGELVIVTSYNLTTREGEGGEQKVYGLLSDGSMITNDQFHVIPVVEIKATVIEG